MSSQGVSSSRSPAFFERKYAFRIPVVRSVRSTGQAPSPGRGGHVLASTVRIANHTPPGLATWSGRGEGPRHIRAAFEQADLNQNLVRKIFEGISPMAYAQICGERKQVLVVHARYDLTFLEEFSLEVLEKFEEYNIDYTSRVLPCGHYTTGETPYKYLDAWYLGSFVHKAFKRLGKTPLELPQLENA